MSGPAGDSAVPVRVPKCSRCRNHGFVVPVRGHSGRCGWKLCTCPKCALISERHKILAAHKLLRRGAARGEGAHPGEAHPGEAHAEVAPGPGHPETSAEHRPPGGRYSTGTAAGPPMLSEYVPSPEFFEKETPRMYPGCPPMYHYHPFPMGFAVTPPGFRGVGIPQRGVRHSHPMSLQDAGGDFRHGYYPPVPPFIPPGFLPGIHYLRPPAPLNVSVMADHSRDVSGPSCKMMPERSQAQGREQSS
ncbi:hypothetical protein FKM82_002091 [Ascaphus truei]